MIDRFYYSLASREKMAWLMNALDLEDAKLFDHWRVKNSATEREDIRGFVDSILEKLYGLNLFFNKVDNESDVQPITDLKHYQEELAQAEHVRWVNTRILSGYHYEPESNDRYFASSKLVNWNDLSSDDRKQYHDSIEQIIPIVNRIFNTGNKYKTFFHFHTSVCAKTYIFLASFTLSPPDSHPANNWPAGRKNYMQVQPDIHASGENISCQCAKRFMQRVKKTRKGCQNTDVSTAFSNSLFVYINYNIRSYNFFSSG